MGVQYYSGETDRAKYIYLKKDDLLQSLPEFHDSIEMIFMLEGEAEAHLNDKSYVLRPGEIIFVDSYEGHWYKYQPNKVLAYVLVLSREYLQNFHELYFEQTFMTYMSDKEKNKPLFDLVEKWYGEKEKTHIKDLGYANILFSYFIERYPLPKKTKKNDKDEFIKRVLSYIHEHYLENISLSKVAKEFGYSEDYCSRILKKYIGRDFREYVNMLRIRKANALMTDDSLHMTTLEILYKCGFQSAATFYRAKKRFENEGAAVGKRKKTKRENEKE